MRLEGRTIPLAACNPRLYDAKWATTADFANAMGVQFDCPGCKLAGRKNHRLAMNFKGRSEHPSWWNPGGSTSLADLTFVDDGGGHTRSLRVLGDGEHLCRSHFNITNGVVDFYHDAEAP